jgi:hypothetical protein
MAGFGVVIETYHVSPVRNPSFMQQRPFPGRISANPIKASSGLMLSSS